MSQLTIGGRERQALVDLQQTVAPLIEKSISRDSDTVSSLRLLNSWQAFSIEIDQLFFYFQDQSLSVDEYNDFQSNLHKLLGLLDGLVHDDALTALGAVRSEQDRKASKAVVDAEEHTMLGYQKLEALVRSTVEQEDLAKSSLLLKLPTTEDKSSEIEKAVTDLNVSNFITRNTAKWMERNDHCPAEISHHSKSRIFKHESDSNEVDESQVFTTTLLKALAEKASRSKCDFPHGARVQVRDPEPSQSVYQGLRQQIFISRCLRMDEWQETYCELVSQVTPLALKPDQSLKRMGSICKAVERSSENGRRLDLLMYTGSLLHDPGQIALIKQPPLWPILSFEDVLRIDASHYMPRDKAILAANLARALLRVHSGDLRLRELKAKDVFFLFNPGNGLVPDGHNPYMAYSLNSPPNGDESGNGRVESDGEPLEDDNQDKKMPAFKFPLLVSFAELLMEIALGKKLGPYDCRVDIALLAEIDPKHYTGEVVKVVSKDYVDVIIQCLLASQGDIHDSDSDSGSDSDSDYESDERRGQGIRNHSRLSRQERNEQARNASREAEETLCRRVIRAGLASLEKSRGMFACGALTPHQFTVKESDRALASKGLNPADKSGESVMAEQFFDEAKLKVASTDQRVVWADQFFRSAEIFYHGKIQDLPVTKNNRISVAVLDTGVDKASEFWRGARYIRKIADSPLKQTKSFVGGSIDDELGHGTNVAAIVSKIAPESDLYIAKISHGRLTEGVHRTIIEAIDWAVKNGVRIINMSFCLPRNPKNEEVRKKIQQVAMSHGVIFVAAASNYGNNEARGFPAKLSEAVICVHAVDGNGNKSGMNPPPEPRRRNFGSLGVAVRSEWGADDVYLEGTSYAAPVTTGVISNVLRFVQYARDKGLMTEGYYKEAFSSRGMSNILEAMAELTSDGYEYIRPKWRIWGETDKEEDIVTKMQSAMERDMD